MGTIAVCDLATLTGMPLLGDEMPPSYNYLLGPLHFVSSLLLPELELQPALPTSSRTVWLEVGPVPEALAAPLLSTTFCQVNAAEFLLRIPGTGRFYAREGSSVIVDPFPGTPLLDVRAYLFSSIFGALCHQRGFLPLHGSAIRTAQGAIAFLGNSGAGKSSIAAFLSQRGYSAVADDLCLTDPAASRASRVMPVAPWLKLWQDTLETLPPPPQAMLHRAFSEDDKYRVPVSAAEAPLPLAQVILLSVADPAPAEIAPVTFERLRPAAAVRALMDFTFQHWLVTATGQSADYFARCGKILEGVEVWSMTRAWGFSRMEAVLNGLEEHFQRSGLARL